MRVAYIRATVVSSVISSIAGLILGENGIVKIAMRDFIFWSEMYR
jgi:hypothetical protein